MIAFKNMKRLFLFVLACLLLTGCYFAYQYWQQERWYDFPTTESNEPQASVIVNRDFAYHIGDRIPVSIRIKQKPGTQVDVSAITIKGPFEVAEAQPLVRKELEDGSICFKQDIILQSFAVQKKMKATAELSWKAENDDTGKELKLPIGPLFTSNTYDGRDILQEGKTEKLSPWLHWTRSIAPLVISTLIVLYLMVKTWQLIRQIWAYKRPLKAALRALARLWLPIDNGDLSPKNYVEIESSIRTLYGVEAALPSEIKHLPDNLPALSKDLRRFIELGQTAIYSDGQRLTSRENAEMKKLSIQLCTAAFQPKPAKKK